MAIEWLIDIGRIRTQPITKDLEKQAPCGCGGTLKYNVVPHVFIFNRERTDVTEIGAFRCNQCTHTLFPRAVADELEWRIDHAMGRLSFVQKFLGLIKGYPSLPDPCTMLKLL